MILAFTKTCVINGRRKPTTFEQKIKEGIKKHTIRLDLNNRWEKGRKIHFATGVRSSQYNCFKIGACTGVQGIIIRSNYIKDIEIEGRSLSYEEIEKLARQDGFDNISDFWAYFSFYKFVEGKIIHWTDLRY
jgi:hypothetical protein